ncbi:hypothetical protein N9L47_06110 [Rhodobacteraceae bacterium]|nr:hypothetical protein [Paracoccaceae bacterium]
MSRKHSFGHLSDLINDETEWGVSVKEAKAQQNLLGRIMKYAAYSVYILASFVAIPVLIGVAFFPAAEGLAIDALIVLIIIGLAVFFQAQSKKGPRNSLQIDYAASEVRLGSAMPDGTFVRHRVCSFRHIEKVSVNSQDKTCPALSLHLSGEEVTVRFKDADPRSLDMVAAKISAARETAQKAPLRSRVQSVFLGIDASYREVGQRVKSRIVSRTV